jgi:uncharacterized protein YjbJ (UPF0337 family)
MGDRTQRLKGKANETIGDAKIKASRTRASKSTGAGGVAQKAKGKTQQTVGKARSAVKKSTR